jgi:hypothetical protein
MMKFAGKGKVRHEFAELFTKTRQLTPISVVFDKLLLRSTQTRGGTF